MNNKVTFNEDVGPSKVPMTFIQGAFYRRTRSWCRDILIGISETHAIDPKNGDVWTPSTPYERVYGRLTIEAERE